MKISLYKHLEKLKWPYHAYREQTVRWITHKADRPTGSARNNLDPRSTKQLLPFGFARRHIYLDDEGTGSTHASPPSCLSCILPPRCLVFYPASAWWGANAGDVGPASIRGDPWWGRSRARQSAALSTPAQEERQEVHSLRKHPALRPVYHLNTTKKTVGR